MKTNITKSGKFQDEYEWAVKHPQETKAQAFLSLAQLYRIHPDRPTLGLIQAAAASIRKIIEMPS